MSRREGFATTLHGRKLADEPSGQRGSGYANQERWVTLCKPLVCCPICIVRENRGAISLGTDEVADAESGAGRIRTDSVLQELCHKSSKAAIEWTWSVIPARMVRHTFLRVLIATSDEDVWPIS